ncbi:MAG: hypothetical protein KDD35_05125 [Bdellovibrionales bacterium]|nr:hypothetical protein [Bdellovibrionales bacterium]
MRRHSSVVKDENSGDIVFDYHPKTFPMVVTAQASEFVSSQDAKASDFRISELVSQQTGIASLKRKGTEDKIEELVLQRIKDIQEKSYREAYDLGLIEGSEKAFGEKQAEIEDKLASLDALLDQFEGIKQRLMAENERQIIEMVVQVAGRIALKQIEEDPQSILYTLEMVMADVHKEEEVRLSLSASDSSTIELFRQKSDKKAQEFKHLKLEINENIRAGGCILETNYGIIDATIEQRVERVLLAMRERMPKTFGEPTSTLSEGDTSLDKSSKSVSDSDSDSGEE